jgi:hypothetical protein
MKELKDCSQQFLVKVKPSIHHQSTPISFWKAILSNHSSIAHVRKVKWNIREEKMRWEDEEMMGWRDEEVRRWGDEGMRCGHEIRKDISEGNTNESVVDLLEWVYSYEWEWVRKAVHVDLFLESLESSI